MSVVCALSSPMMSASNVRFLANAAPARRLIRPARPTDRRTTEIRVVAGFIDGWAKLVPCSISLPAVVIVGGVPTQVLAAAHMGAYRCATNGGGWGPGHTDNVRIRRDLSLRTGSAREPQRLPRRRFPLSAPRIVASLMEAPASLAVRCFRPPVACDDRPATTLTADDVRVDDEMVPDPLVDPISLVTDGGEASRIDLVEKVVHLNAPGSSPPRQRRTWRRRHPPCRDGAAAALCGRALELAAKEARARSPR